MGLVDERNLRRLPGFPLGINNTAHEAALPVNEQGLPLAVRDALNVDFDAAGKFRRRAGHALAVPLPEAHSLFAAKDFPFLMARDDHALYALGPELEPEQVVDGLGDGETSYCELNGELLWTIEGRACGRVDSMLVNRELAVPTPAGPPQVSAASNGGLAAGTYRVYLSYMDARGEEGGASRPASVELAANGAIQLQLAPPPAGVEVVRVWVTEANATVAYHAADLYPAELSATITASARGKALETHDLRPLPPGHLVRELNGIVLMAVGHQLLYGEAARPRLHHPGRNFVPFKARVDLLQVVGEGAAAGVFVAAGKRVYFLSGATPKQFGVRMVRTAGAVPGTGLNVPAESVGVEGVEGEVACWMGTDGTPCLGLPGGVVRPLAKGAAMTQFARGATLLREVNGLRQLLFAGPQGPTGSVVATDAVEVFQYRDGKLIP